MSIAGEDISLSAVNVTPEKLSPLQLLQLHGFQGKVTRTFREKAIRMCRAGVPPKIACRTLGTADSTIRLWQQLASDDTCRDKRAILWRELLQAQDEAIARVSENATRLTEKDGRVALDYLGRRDPEHWKREDTLNVEVDIGARIAGVVNEVLARTVPWEELEGEHDECRETEALQGPEDRNADRNGGG